MSENEIKKRFDKLTEENQELKERLQQMEVVIRHLKRQMRK